MYSGVFQRVPPPSPIFFSYRKKKGTRREEKNPSLMDVLNALLASQEAVSGCWIRRRRRGMRGAIIHAAVGHHCKRWKVSRSHTRTNTVKHSRPASDAKPSIYFTLDGRVICFTLQRTAFRSTGSCYRCSNSFLLTYSMKQWVLLAAAFLVKFNTYSCSPFFSQSSLTPDTFFSNSITNKKTRRGKWE